MRDYDKRHTVLGANARYQLRDRACVEVIKISCRLICEDYVRARNQSTGYRHALALAARELPRAVGRSINKAHLIEQRSRPGIGLCTPNSADIQRHGHVFNRIEFGEQMVELIHKAKRRIAQPSPCTVLEC